MRTLHSLFEDICNAWFEQIQQIRHIIGALDIKDGSFDAPLPFNTENVQRATYFFLHRCGADKLYQGLLLLWLLFSNKKQRNSISKQICSIVILIRAVPTCCRNHSSFILISWNSHTFDIYHTHLSAKNSATIYHSNIVFYKHHKRSLGLNMAGLFQVCDLYVRIVLIHAFQNI